MARLPSYFISHGGGPWPYMREQTGGMYDHLAQSLQDMPRQIGVRPQAVLVISGHWEEREFTVMAGAEAPMVYDCCRRRMAASCSFRRRSLSRRSRSALKVFQS